MITINLEEGRPSVREALDQFHSRLENLLHRRHAVKLIHGYGSTGTGGVIRKAVRQELENMMEARQIRYFIPGEDWSVNDEATRLWLSAFPELRCDDDLGRENPGISIAILRSAPESAFSLPVVRCELARLADVLDGLKSCGHAVAKVIGPTEAAGFAAFKQAHRVLKKEDRIKHFIPGESWTRVSPDTLRWIRKFPQCDGDLDLMLQITNIIVVFFVRRLRRAAGSRVSTQASVEIPSVLARLSSAA